MKKTGLFFTGICVIGFCLFLTQCKQLPKGVNLKIDADPFEKLSEYHLFKGILKDLLPNDGVLPYDLITPLFSDYAKKARFIWMPKGKSAQYSRDNALNFPVGAVLIKNFYYPYDFRDESKGRRIIETRLLVRNTKGWDARTYIWNDEQSDAVLEIAGDSKHVEWVDEKGQKMTDEYTIPNKNQCKGCHNEKETIVPIGPKVRNLNRFFTYTDGKMNQLDKWATMGYLSGYDAKVPQPKLACWNDPASGTVEERAKAYLEVNCAHCHNANGPANTSGFYLNTLDNDPIKWGICKEPVAAGKGSGNRIVDILPGKPEESIVIYRMESLDPGTMMPELGRKMNHVEGIQLIKDWITSMPVKDCN